MFNKNIGFDMLTDSSMPRKVGVWDLSKKGTDFPTENKTKTVSSKSSRMESWDLKTSTLKYVMARNERFHQNRKV